MDEISGRVGRVVKPLTAHSRPTRQLPQAVADVKTSPPPPTPVASAINRFCTSGAAVAFETITSSV